MGKEYEMVRAGILSYSFLKFQHHFSGVELEELLVYF